MKHFEENAATKVIHLATYRKPISINLMNEVFDISRKASLASPVDYDVLADCRIAINMYHSEYLRRRSISKFEILDLEEA